MFELIEQKRIIKIQKLLITAIIIPASFWILYVLYAFSFNFSAFSSDMILSFLNTKRQTRVNLACLLNLQV